MVAPLGLCWGRNSALLWSLAFTEIAVELLDHVFQDVGVEISIISRASTASAWMIVFQNLNDAVLLPR